MIVKRQKPLAMKAAAQDGGQVSHGHAPDQLGDFEASLHHNKITLIFVYYSLYLLCSYSIVLHNAIQDLVHVLGGSNNARAIFAFGRTEEQVKRDLPAIRFSCLYRNRFSGCTRVTLCNDLIDLYLLSSGILLILVCTV